METTVPILIGLTAAVFLCMGAIRDDRRARARRREDREEPARAIPLLHSINDDRCIGCEACIDVCPTEVLDLVEHKVRVARFSDCVQCEQCANACPTQALVMYREGTTPRMLTVPELDEHFQTGVPGQYLIGEVAGKPLVKNAANLGRAVIEHIARDLAQRPAAADVLDVAIVGSGPGGLSAGLACLKHKLSCVVLEKEHVISSTVSRYPKGKHFMAEPCTAQNVSYLPVFDASKEELVAAWQQVVEGVELPIKLGEAVETVQRGDDGVFTIKTTVGTYRARTVVLATGLRGKPRLLIVPGANLEKVQSLLDDPAEFAGEAVLVVGGGDSALEGAMALADAGATVTLSYRGDGFKRCKQGNQKRLAEMTAGQRLTVLLESNVTCFTPDSVTIKLADKSETTIANQRAFVLIGADTPVAWLEANNVRFVERPHLYALGSTEDVVRRFAPDATECPRTPAEAVAIVLDRPVPRSSTRRVQAVVEHLRDELREVVTSVSSAFRLSDLEARDAGRAPKHTPPRPSQRATSRGIEAVRARSQVIPASRLTAGRPAPQRAQAGGAIRRGIFGSEPTIVGPAPVAIQLGIFGSDPTMVGPVPVAPLARLTPLRPRSPQPHAHTKPGNGAMRDLPAPRRELTTAQAKSLRKSRTTTALPRVPDPTTVEIRSLPALEQEALQLAALRCKDEGATLEMSSLPEREQAALQRAALRCADDGVFTSPLPEPKRTLSTATVRRPDHGAEEIPSQQLLEHPLDNSTDVETPSLRALERPIEVEMPSVSPLDSATEVDMASLRALERSTEVAMASLPTREIPDAVAAGARRPQTAAAKHVVLAEGSSPDALRHATETASSHAVPEAANRRVATTSVLTSAPRPPMQSTRPSANPPPLPPRSIRSDATPPRSTQPDAIPPPLPPRSTRPSATPPPLPPLSTRPDATPPRSTRPDATPSPLPTQPPQLPRGTAAIPKRPPTPAQTPTHLAPAPLGEDAVATVVRGARPFR